MNKPYVTLVVDADSICYAAGMANNIKEAEFSFTNYINKLKKRFNPVQILGFIEGVNGKNIFRNHVAVTKPYKGNRKNKDKPPFVNEMKYFASNKYGFEFTYNIEAEDCATIAANEIGLESCIKCCCDKDMLTAPGFFHNYFGTEWRLPNYTKIDDYVIQVSPEQAEWNLFIQCTTGDSDDGFSGVKGVATKTAMKLLQEHVENGLTLAQGSGKVHKDNGYDYAYFIETSRLAYILRQRKDVFTPLTKEEWDKL